MKYKKYIILILLIVNKVFGQNVSVKDTIVLKFDTNSYMEKSSFKNTMGKKEYSFIYKIKEYDEEDAVSITDFNFSTVSKAQNYKCKVIRKDMNWLDSKVVLNYNFFQKNSINYLLNFFYRENIVLYILEKEKRKDRDLLLQEVFF